MAAGNHNMCAVYCIVLHWLVLVNGLAGFSRDKGVHHQGISWPFVLQSCRVEYRVPVRNHRIRGQEPSAAD
jgi:hypothetical protein